MRLKSKVDANQREIAAALRKAGVSVALTHAMGGGFPDAVCGYRGSTHLMEIKDGKKPPSARKLTAAQVRFHDEWRGSDIHVVTSIEEALAAVLGLTN